MNILYNAKIYTQDKTHPQASALIIHEDRILAIGSDQEILAEARPGWQKTDMGGKTIWPGLVDSHMHFGLYALTLQNVFCETKTRQECVDNVAEKARQVPPGTWIQGLGWNHNVWPEGYGTAEMLDRAAPDHPVLLTAKSVHASWANSLALQKAGITADTPDPEGGVIQRDASGKPTGILLETASDLVYRVIPPATIDEYSSAILNTQKVLWKYGVVGLHDVDITLVFQTLQKLDLSGELRLRVTKCIPGTELEHAVAVGLRTGFGSDYLRVGWVKNFSDGTIGQQTAALFEDFTGSPGNKGILLITADEMFEIGKKAASSGLALTTHCLGDRANHEVLNGYEKLRAYEKENHMPALRHRIEHAQVLKPEEFGRFAKLGITVSAQPIQTASDIFICDRFLGPERSRNTFVFKTLLDLGTHITFGADAPVEIPNPWLGIHAAVTRRRPDGTPGPEGWYPEQRLTLQQAFDGYTLGPAYASSLEKIHGKLAPGYYADLIVLDCDPFSIPVDDLHAVLPSATMVGGDWVWQA